jgi:hypothetical protein
MTGSDLFNKYYTSAKKTDYIFNQYSAYQTHFGLHVYDFEMKIFYKRSSFIFCKLLKLATSPPVTKNQLLNMYPSAAFIEETVSLVKENCFYFERVVQFLEENKEKLIIFLDMISDLRVFNAELDYLETTLERANVNLINTECLIESDMMAYSLQQQYA